jgi:hypothetical protein
MVQKGKSQIIGWEINSKIDEMSFKIKQITIKCQKANANKEYYKKCLYKLRNDFKGLAINHKEVKRENTALRKDFYDLLDRIDQFEKANLNTNNSNSHLSQEHRDSSKTS